MLHGYFFAAPQAFSARAVSPLARFRTSEPYFFAQFQEKYVM
jgi:hypothetical protein